MAAAQYIDGNGFMKLVKSGEKDLSLVLLFGSEDYYIENCIKAVKAAYLTEGSEDMDLNVIARDSRDDYQSLEGYIQMPPWMSRKRVIICRSDYIYGHEFGEEEERILSSIPSSCVVVFCPEKCEKNRRITKYILKNGVAAEVNILPDDVLAGLAKNSLAKQNIRIASDVCLSLVSRCESRMRMISSELEKLKLYCAGSGRDELTFDDLDRMCPPDLNASVFAITDCFGSGKCDTALKTLDSLLIRKEPAKKLQATLLTHLKRLIIAKDVGDTRTLVNDYKYNRFYADKLVKQSSRFTIDELFKLYFAAVQADSDVNHGLSDDRTALETLIVKAAIS
ncbi:MAG: DNA polymerase III subunit delta [Clostridiales bacterium]|nr:DNA polymerase III subunit delta [Clostridiales bacterium]